MLTIVNNCLTANFNGSYVIYRSCNYALYFNFSMLLNKSHESINNFESPTSSLVFMSQRILAVSHRQRKSKDYLNNTYLLVTKIDTITIWNKRKYNTRDSQCTLFSSSSRLSSLTLPNTFLQKNLIWKSQCKFFCHENNVSCQNLNEIKKYTWYVAQAHSVCYAR